MPDLFFNPSTIAVIGATSNPKKFGNAVTLNILSNKNLKSELFLISRSSEEIFGHKCYKTLFDVPKEIDLAILLIPAKTVMSVIDDCIKKKVKRIIIVTSGFGEINEEGKKIEKVIADKCNKANIRVMGPNCVGIQNTEIQLNASFIQMPKKGRIGMISQSGSIGCATFYALQNDNLGISKFANIGNAIDISFTEILDYLSKDSDTELITIYLESIKDAKEFFNKLKEITLKKPIVLLKGGKTKSGLKAASSHTGSVATDYKILSTAVKQANGIMCESMQDFIISIKTLSLLPTPKGDKIGVITNSGGSAVLFSDSAELFDLKLVDFSQNLINKLTPHLIPLVKKVNPLDMIAGAAREQYYQITKTLLEDPSIDIVVVGCVIPPFLEMKTDEHYRGVVDAWNDTNRVKPIIPMFLFSEDFEDVKEIAYNEKAPLYYTPNEAAFAIKTLLNRMKLLKVDS